MLKKISPSYIYLFLFFYVNPFIDAITGYLVLSGIVAQGGLGSPSQLFRFIISIVLLLSLKDRKHLFFIYSFIIYIIAVELLNFLFHLDQDGFIVSLAYSYKLVFGFLLYFKLDELIKNKFLDRSIFINFIIHSGIIYSFIVLFTDLLGVSFGSYENGLGSKGVFASANGLGIYIGICALLLIYKNSRKINMKYFFSYSLMSYTLLGLMTRASVGLFVISLFIILFKIPGKYKLITYSLILFSLIYLGNIFIDIFLNATEVITYRYSNTSSMEEFFGGRQGYLDYAFNEFSTEGILLYRLLIGGGYFLSFRNPNSIDNSVSNFLEVDLYDVFYMYGFVGLVVYSSIFLKGLVWGIKNKTNIILILAWILLYGHSALAGHVIQNGMSIIMLICILLIIKYTDKNENLVSIS